MVAVTYTMHDVMQWQGMTGWGGGQHTILLHEPLMLSLWLQPLLKLGTQQWVFNRVWSWSQRSNTRSAYLQCTWMLQKCDTVITLSHTDLHWEAFELELVCCLVYDTRSLLGICMRIRCLTWSTWKDRNSEPQSAGETMPCCPPPICSQVSEQSKSLKW